MARKKAAAAAAEQVDNHAVVEGWFRDANALLIACKRLSRYSDVTKSHVFSKCEFTEPIDSLLFIETYINLGIVPEEQEQHEFDLLVVRGLFDNSLESKEAFASKLLYESHYLAFVTGSLLVRKQSPLLQDLFGIAYARIGRDFQCGKYLGGLFAWDVLIPMADDMFAWTEDLAEFYRKASENRDSKLERQYREHCDRCPFDPSIDYAIRERLTLEYSQIIRDLATIHRKQVPADKTPKTKEQTRKETLKAAKPKTLKRFLEDAVVYSRYLQWKKTHRKSTLQNFAATERMKTKALEELQQRYHTRDHQGWTTKNVQAELERKLANEDS